MNITALEITTRIGCSNKCSYCPQDLLVSRYTGEKLMSFDTFKTCIDKLDDSTEIHFTGMCEPFLNPKCMDMIEYASLKHKVLISTTLRGLKAKDIPRLEAIDFIDFAIHMPAKSGDSIPDSKFLKAIGNSSIQNLKYHCHGETDYKVTYVNTHTRAGNVEGQQVTPKAGFIHCERNKQCPVLLPNGDLVLCCMDYGLQYVVGNLLTQDIKDIEPVESELCKLCVYGYPSIGFVTYEAFHKCNAASSRIRVDWPAKYADGFIVTENAVDLFKCSAVVFQTRFSYQDVQLAAQLRNNGIKIICDFTDPDWSNMYSGMSDSLKTMLELADCITVPTYVLANMFKSVSDKPVYVIPDRIDLSLYDKTKKHTDTKSLRILWHGSYGNLCSIDIARDDLERLGKEIDITLVCVYDHYKEHIVNAFENIKVECYEWTNQKVIDELLLCDLSINPRFDNHWKAYKSNNKTITAWACGIPCIERDFYNEIKRYDLDLRISDGLNFRKIVEQNYDVKQSTKEIIDLVNDLMAGGRPKNNITVMTAICNKFDGLREDQILGKADYVAFVNQPTTSYAWNVRKIYPKFYDPVLEAKIFKIIPWYFVDTEYSIWIDGTQAIKCDPQMLIDKFLNGYDMAIFPHSVRDDIYDEYEVDLNYRQVEPSIFRETQRQKYIDEGIPRKSGLWECGIIIRRHTQEVKRLCETWWAEVSGYTHSDQCSLIYALSKHNVVVNAITPGTQYNNPYFNYVTHPNTWKCSIDVKDNIIVPKGSVRLKRISKDTFHSHFTDRMNYGDVVGIDSEFAQRLLNDYPGDFAII